MGLCSSSSGLVGVGGGLFFGSPKGGRGVGQEVSPPVSTSFRVYLPLPRAGMGMGGLVVRVERMEEAERGRAEGGAMSVSSIRMRLAQ